MRQLKHRHRSLAVWLLLLGLILAQAQDFDSPGFQGDGATIATGAGETEADSLVQAMDEIVLGEEADVGEGGEDLMDLGGMIENKAPSVSSVGGASVASSFNFTKAAEMRAATMQRSKANATAAAAPPLQAQALQPGAKAGTVPPATSAAAGTGNLQPGQPQQPAAGMLASLPPAASAPAGTRAGAAARQPAQGNLGDPPGTGALAGKAAAANTHTAAKLAALGAPAGIPGGRGGELTDSSLRDQRSISEASVLPESAQDPRAELGASANVSGVPPTNFQGAAHIAKRQARHYKALPGTVSRECRARLTQLVSNGRGESFEAGSLAELLGNVSALVQRRAQAQMDDVLASILSDSATHYIDFHLSHTISKYDECKKSATLETLKACLIRNKKQLRHSEIMWFDESFLAVLAERLGDVRSMFGFGSGRGDFERYFYEQGTAYTYGLEPGFLGSLAFYAPGWEYREGPVQLTTLLPNATGVQELEEFRCYMTGDAHHRVDLVQSFETFEEIPREEHCGIINVLAGMAQRWVAVTMGQLGQGGGHHIANRHKEDFLNEWTRRGLVYREDLTSSIREDCYMCQLHYLRFNLFIFEVDPSRVVPVDCDRESSAEWAPYENFEEQMVYLPNGTRSPSHLHEKQYQDWQYVLRLKAG